MGKSKPDRMTVNCCNTCLCSACAWAQASQKHATRDELWIRRFRGNDRQDMPRGLFMGLTGLSWGYIVWELVIS